MIRTLFTQLFLASLVASFASTVSAEPLIVTEDVDVPEVHCSVAAAHSGTELWQMIRRPYVVVYDADNWTCHTASARLQATQPSRRPFRRPGRPPISWCYCRYEVAESLLGLIRGYDTDLYNQILISEHNAFIHESLRLGNLPPGTTRETTRLLLESMGLTPIDPTAVDAQILEQIERNVNMRTQEGFSFPLTPGGQ